MIAHVAEATPWGNFGIGVVNGILYVVGGTCCSRGSGSHIFATVEAYDPTTNTWTTKAPMLTPRRNLAVGVANQVLHAVGGWRDVSGENFDVPVSVVEAYDPIRNAWTTKALLPGNRNGVGLGDVKGILCAVGRVIRSSAGPKSPSKYDGLVARQRSVANVLCRLPPAVT